MTTSDPDGPSDQDNNRAIRRLLNRGYEPRTYSAGILAIIRDYVPGGRRGKSPEVLLQRLEALSATELVERSA